MTALGEKVLVVSDPSDETPGGLYVYDGQVVEVIDRLSTTGLALTPDGRLLRLPRSFDESRSAGELLVYDRKGVLGYHRLDMIADAHGICWHRDRCVVASTAGNAIAWLDDSGRVTARWQPVGERDAWHLNDVLSHAGMLYASAFGRFARNREWGGRMSGSGVVVRVPDGKVVLGGLTAPHNPRVADGGWLVCNSGTRELLVFDRAGRRPAHRVALRTWPRGVAAYEQMLFVGESEHRIENADPHARATIAVVDTRSWTVVDRIQVPGREIYDLLVVPAALTDGLATGFGTNLARVRSSSQLSLFEQVGVEPTRLWAVGEPLPPADRRARIEARIPPRLPPDTTVDIDVVLENLGSSILVSALPNPVYLTYRWYRDGDDGPIVESPIMSPLPRAVPPSTPTSCAVRVRTHAESTYRLRITLAQEYVGWFDDVDAASVAEGFVEVTSRATG